jgi:hypothetical protein
MSAVEFGVAHVDGPSWGRIYGSPPEPVRFDRRLLPTFQNLDDVAFVRDPADPAFAIKVTFASVVHHYIQRANPSGVIDADAAQSLNIFIVSQITALSDTKRDRDLDRMRRKLDRIAKAAGSAGGTVTLNILAAAGAIDD